MKKLSLLLLLPVLAVSCNRPQPASVTNEPATNQSSTDQSGNYLVIAEWGVEFQKPPAMDDLQYAKFGSDNTVSFITQQLINLDQSTSGKYCVLDNAPIGLLSRVKNFDDFKESGHFIPENVKIDDYYYYFTPPQEACSDNKQVQAMTEAQRNGLADRVLSTLRDDGNSEIRENIYTNNSLGFSIQFPNDAKPSLELNDQYNRLTAFGDLPGKYFEVRLYEDDPNMTLGFLGADVVSEDIKLGGINGYKAVSTTGYADAGMQGDPYVDFGARYKGDVYHLIFYGDANVSQEELQILSTFKFIK